MNVTRKHGDVYNLSRLSTLPIVSSLVPRLSCMGGQEPGNEAIIVSALSRGKGSGDH